MIANWMYESGDTSACSSTDKLKHNDEEWWRVELSGVFKGSFTIGDLYSRLFQKKKEWRVY